MQKPKNPFPVVAVEWNDAEVSPNWTFSNQLGQDIEDYSSCATVGYLVYEDESFVRIAATAAWSGDEWLFNAIQLIPKGMLVKRKILKNGKQAPGAENKKKESLHIRQRSSIRLSTGDRTGSEAGGSTDQAKT